MLVSFEYQSEYLALKRNELMEDDEESQGFTTFVGVLDQNSVIVVAVMVCAPTLYKKIIIFNRVYVQSNSITC